MARVSWDTQYENGDMRLLKVLTDYDGNGNFLHPEATLQLKAMDAAFFARFGKHIRISEGFRNLSMQNYYWDLFNSGKGYPAARPGTSTHGEGVAIDIVSSVYGNSSGSAEHRWLRENGPAYGWDWYLVGSPSGEPWHFNYRFGLRTIVASAASVEKPQPKLTTVITRRRRMSTIQMQFLTTGVGVISGPGGTYGFSTFEDWRLVKRYLYGKLDGNGNVTNGETETFIDWELNKILSILDKVDAKPTIFKAFRVLDGKEAGKIWLFGPSLKWHIPSMAYVGLLQARGLIARTYDSVPQAEIDLYSSFFLAGEQNDELVLKTVNSILSLSDKQAEAQTKSIIAARIPEKTEGVPEEILKNLAA